MLRQSSPGFRKYQAQHPGKQVNSHVKAKCLIVRNIYQVREACVFLIERHCVGGMGLLPEKYEGCGNLEINISFHVTNNT